MAAPVHWLVDSNRVAPADEPSGTNTTSMSAPGKVCLSTSLAAAWEGGKQPGVSKYPFNGEAKELQAVPEPNGRNGE